MYYQSNSVVLVEDRYLNQLEVYAVRQPLKVLKRNITHMLRWKRKQNYTKYSEPGEREKK